MNVFSFYWIYWLIRLYGFQMYNSIIIYHLYIVLCVHHPKWMCLIWCHKYRYLDIIWYYTLPQKYWSKFCSSEKMVAKKNLEEQFQSQVCVWCTQTDMNVCHFIFDRHSCHFMNEMSVILLFRFCLFILERVEGGKERERSIDIREIHQLGASCTPPTGDLTCNPGMCPE